MDDLDISADLTFLAFCQPTFPIPRLYRCMRGLVLSFRSSLIHEISRRPIRPLYRFLSTSPLSSFRTTSSTLYSTKKNTPLMATRDAVVPQAERLFDGNMHKSDVWSIFTSVTYSFFFWTLFTLLPSSFILSTFPLTPRPIPSMVAVVQSIACCNL